MAINLNFTDVKSEFEILPKGKYYGKVVKAVAEMNKVGDALVVKLQWEVQDEEYAGSKIFDNLSTKPQALFKLKNLLDVLGFDASGEFELDPESLIDQECYLMVDIQNYQGKDSNTVKSYAAE